VENARSPSHRAALCSERICVLAASFARFDKIFFFFFLCFFLFGCFRECRFEIESLTLVALKVLRVTPVLKSTRPTAFLSFVL
jgi:hypothetical protein